MHQGHNYETHLKYTNQKRFSLRDGGKSEIEDHSSDAGNKEDNHYKKRLSPIRYKLRSLLLPVIRYETEILYKLQTCLRNPFFDFYFAWTANLASHTFYVLMLPPPIWFGASDLSRDLVYVLGLGIYITGFLKDYFCLPRPRSPPLHRITMSSYTTQEYGFPSSHSANATAVTLVVFKSLLTHRANFASSTFYALIYGLILYYCSLIFGRLYCGMHGFFDILVGSSVGALLFLFRLYWGKQWDQFLFSHGIIIGIMLIIGIFVSLIHFHAEPVDDCPCFDDSVAFIGVLIGLDLSHLIAYETKVFYNLNDIGDMFLIPFDAKRGPLNIICRFVAGVVLVVAWKSLSKPMIFTILPPVYKFIGIYLPRRNFIATAHTSQSTRHIRSASISNDVSQIGDLSNFIKGVTDHKTLDLDNYGPNSEIDYYEMIDYSKQYNDTSIDVEKLKFKSGVFKYRYDVEIVGRLFVYAGIAASAIWAFYFVSSILNL
ncbi:LCB3 [Candida oxycetoniae]|uniref:LCB3 n=1 Tax=Candida oxycetoniae TaxID=497107 RepID=A0AAI9SZR5_9ASCO|nr:LCB3 [Candida oxycetoniae]KAI3405355.2 LCB3 [Candida oxycetoniae]